jgi:hypothetical protein
MRSWVMGQMCSGHTAESIYATVRNLPPTHFAYGLSWTYLTRILRECSHLKMTSSGKQ